MVLPGSTIPQVKKQVMMNLTIQNRVQLGLQVGFSGSGLSDRYLIWIYFIVLDLDPSLIHHLVGLGQVQFLGDRPDFVLNQFGPSSWALYLTSWCWTVIVGLLGFRIELILRLLENSTRIWIIKIEL